MLGFMTQQQNILETLFLDRTPAEQMVWLLRLRILISAVSAAARIGLPDAISDEALSADDIAKATNSDAQATFRLLRALASIGIFEEISPRRFGHTPLSLTLRTSGPSALREFAMMYSAAWFAPALDGLEYSVRTGESCLARSLGKPGYEWLKEHPEESIIANRAMQLYSDVIEAPCVDHLDLPSEGTVVDIGGGNGAFLAGVLENYPRLHGIVAELPQVVEQARDYLAQRGLENCCRVVPIDMFAGVPAGGDVYLFKRVLHNWRSDKVVTVLQHCRRAMAPNGKLVVIEGVIPNEGPRLFTTLGDIQQLGLNGAGDRTENEFRDLCHAGGFTVTRIDRPSDFVTIIYARPSI